MKGRAPTELRERRGVGRFAEGGEGVEGAGEDVDGIAAGVDGNEQSAGAVVIDDRHGGDAEGGDAGLDRGGVVVATLHERTAAAVAEAVDQRAVKRHMIGDTALRTMPAPGEAFRDVRQRKLVVDDGVERALFLGEEAVERLGLGDGARESVEHETAGAAEAVATLSDEGQDGLVADEAAAVHAPLDVARGGVAGEQAQAGGAEQFARGERARAERGFEQFGLRAFADAGRADQHQTPCALHGGGRLAARGVSAENPRGVIACWGHGRDASRRGAARRRSSCGMLRNSCGK